MNVGSSGDVWDDLMMSIALSVMYLVSPPRGNVKLDSFVALQGWEASPSAHNHNDKIMMVLLEWNKGKWNKGVI